jgi:hypothetical protein
MAMRPSTDTELNLESRGKKQKDCVGCLVRVIFVRKLYVRCREIEGVMGI